MRHILFFALIILASSCTKQASHRPTPQTMTVEQLKISEGIDLIAAWEIQFGNARTTPNGKGKKPDKNDQIVLAPTESLVFDGTTFTTSFNPKFAGVNNQTTFISICNWFFWEENLPPQILTCSNSTGSGNTMAWNTNWQDTVFRSNIITIP